MAVTNSLTPKKTNTSFSAYVSSESVKRNISAVVGANSKKFITSIISAVNNNIALQECTHKSILNAALLGEALNLLPSPQLGQYYLIPFKDKEEKVAQFQLGYKGYIQLAIRSGQYKKLNTLAIKEGELIKFDPLEEEIEINLIEDETEREDAPTAGYYAMFEFHNGFKKAIYWSKKKMLAHATKYSFAYKTDLAKGYNNSFWSKDFDGMAIKTMLRQLISKWGNMSIEIERAIEADMSVIKNIDADGIETEYIDNTEIIEVKKDSIVDTQTKDNTEDDFFNSSTL